MKFYSRAPELLSLNVTPLIDVVFLLLIFFMTSTTFSKETVLDITLPSLQSRQTLPADHRITMTVSPQGEYRINDQQVIKSSLDALTHALALTQAFNADTVILIAADAKAPYQSVMRAMDAAGQLGYAHIQLEGDWR